LSRWGLECGVTGSAVALRGAGANCGGARRNFDDAFQTGFRKKKNKKNRSPQSGGGT